MTIHTRVGESIDTRIETAQLLAQETRKHRNYLLHEVHRCGTVLSLKNSTHTHTRVDPKCCQTHERAQMRSTLLVLAEYTQRPMNISMWSGPWINVSSMESISQESTIQSVVDHHFAIILALLSDKTRFRRSRFHWDCVSVVPHRDKLMWLRCWNKSETSDNSTPRRARSWMTKKKKLTIAPKWLKNKSKLQHFPNACNVPRTQACGSQPRLTVRNLNMFRKKSPTLWCNLYPPGMLMFCFLNDKRCVFTSRSDGS